MNTTKSGCFYDIHKKSPRWNNVGVNQRLFCRCGQTASSCWQAEPRWKHNMFTSSDADATRQVWMLGPARLITTWWNLKTPDRQLPGVRVVKDKRNILTGLSGTFSNSLTFNALAAWRSGATVMFITLFSLADSFRGLLCDLTCKLVWWGCSDTQHSTTSLKWLNHTVTSLYRCHQ